MKMHARESEETRNEDGNYIHDFRKFFGVEEGLDNHILDEQKRVFGFSLFLLHSVSIFDALKNGFLNSKYLNTKFSPWFFLPYVWILFAFWIADFLIAKMAIGWFLPIIFFGLCIIHLPIFFRVHEKIELYKNTRIFFNIEIDQALYILKEFYKIHPENDLKEEQIQDSSFLFYIKLFIRIGIFLFVQMFLFGLFSVLPLFEVLIFDLLILIAIFGYFEKLLLLFLIAYYSAYFYFFDHASFLFSREDRERDFFTDLYKGGTRLLTSLDRLEKDMTDAKDGLIQTSLTENLTKTIREIEGLYHLIDTNASILLTKKKFQYFLIGMLDEVLTVYSYVFETLEQRIHKIEKGIDLSGIRDDQKQKLLLIVRPILDRNRSHLRDTKAKVIKKKLLLKSRLESHSYTYGERA